MQKRMIGLDLNYQFNKDFMVGATVMHMSEMPLTVKTGWKNWKNMVKTGWKS